jgi:hypothetical protein
MSVVLTGLSRASALGNSLGERDIGRGLNASANAAID